jgi:hypothetical protein
MLANLGLRLSQRLAVEVNVRRLPHDSAFDFDGAASRHLAGRETLMSKNEFEPQTKIKEHQSGMDEGEEKSRERRQHAAGHFRIA